MQRTTRQLMGISGAGLLILFAIVSALPPREEDPVATATENVEKESEKVDYSEMARTAQDLHTLKKALKEIEPDVLDVRFKDDIVIIEYDPESSFWDESSLINTFANDSTKLLAALDGNNHYGSFAFERSGTLVDDKGNEEEKGMIRVLYFKSAISSINFDNYPDVVSLNPYKFYENASGYGIYGSLYLNADDEIRYNMPAFKDPENYRYDVYDFGGTTPVTESNIEEDEDDYHVEASTNNNGEPITNEESPEALQSAENVIAGFMAIEDEINDLSDSVYASMDADFLTADAALAIIESTREQAVIAANSFNDVEASKELSGAIGKLDDLKDKLNKYESILGTSEWNADTYDDVLLVVDSFYDDLEFDPVTVKQFLDVYGY
ncbi:MULTISPECIES: hypothetical protein [unclassified Exiguobacterium]|uniref:hypothetical protein n=1 Tax=unclassified Exiguobacterium TaxID=2644629 RepID=UPI001BE6A3D5|nr:MULTISPECIES: hypothetical protein [unclassified Exiguobacterium]